MGGTASCKKSAGSGYPEHDDPGYRKCQELKASRAAFVLCITRTHTYTHFVCLQMERWIQMHYQIKQREQALAIAQHRELFYWLSGFYLSTVYGCASYYQRVKRASVLAPLLPLTFVMGYYTDWAYGSKLHRIQGEYGSISFDLLRFCLIPVCCPHSGGKYDNGARTGAAALARWSAHRGWHWWGTCGNRNGKENASAPHVDGDAVLIIILIIIMFFNSMLV